MVNLGGPARIPIFPIFPTPWEFVKFLRFPTDMITAKLTVNGGTYVHICATWSCYIFSSPPGQVQALELSPGIPFQWLLHLLHLARWGESHEAPTERWGSIARDQRVSLPPSREWQMAQGLNTFHFFSNCSNNVLLITGFAVHVRVCLLYIYI